MKKSKLVLTAVAVMLMAALAGCKKDPAASPDNPNTSVPDPAGTVTSNISTTTSINVPGCGYIKWTSPDNFYVCGTDNDVYICDLGAMKGLGNITSVPFDEASYTDPQQINTTVACESGHGYIIMFFDSDFTPVIVRLYVVEPVVGPDGVMGAKVKYQFPFTNTLTVSTNSLNFTNDKGTQTVTVTTDAPDWTYSCDAYNDSTDSFYTPDWITLTKNKGTLSVSVSANTGATRYAEITIIAGASWEYIGVIQESVDVAVSTAEDLDNVRNNPSFTFSLKNDISLAGYSDWLPIGTQTVPFTGKFKGNGHKITGLSVTAGYDYAGLFGYISGGAVSDLGVETAAGGITGDTYAGGIAGYVTDNGTITNCYSTGNITASSYYDSYSGGIAGYVSGGTITNCYSTGNITASSSSTSSYVYFYSVAGGIVGCTQDGSTIINCAAINPTINGDYLAGRIVGIIIGTNTVTNNFALSTMTATGSTSFYTEVANHGVNKTDAQLKTQSTYSDPVNANGLGGLGWAFGNDDAHPWKMPAGGTGYPALYGQQ